MCRTRWIVGALSILWLGCAPTVSQRPPQINPALRTLLAYYDAHYDPEHQMLQIEFKSPGYHSRISSGTLVHPTRESLIYALALLQRDSGSDADRASRIIRKVLTLQDRDPNSRTRGLWPWLLEEPLAKMAAPDFNWADFCAAQIAQMLVDHADRLPGGLQDAMRESLRLAVGAIRKRDVGPDYTNIAILGGGVCAVAGELFKDADLLAYGRRRLKRVVEHTARHGSFNEYNSPPYAKVVITECERTLHLVRDSATREAAESLRRTAWKIVAESFHPGTQQWAGPHSRTSRERLRTSTVDFLSRRTGVSLRTHPSMSSGKPRGYAVVHPLECPEELVSRFRSWTGDPRQLRRTFVRGPTAAESTIGTTWLAADFCIGSVNRSLLWTQRKPLIAYWKTDKDPAVVFRMRFLHDGRDFASMGVRTAQEGPRALSIFQSVTNRGDWHPTLDRPPDGLFQATDFRVRYQLRGVSVSARALGGGRYALSAGRYQMVIHTRPGRFAGQDTICELGRESQSVFLDVICYSGKKRTFDFRCRLEVVVAVGIELLHVNEPITQQSPRVTQQKSGRVEAVWKIPRGQTLSVDAPGR